MTSSYLGIVSQRGLETLQLETDHLASFLMRRAYRRQRARCLCCWAVLGDREADVITRLIRAGDFDKALLLLNILSIHLGTLVPETDEILASQSTGG